MKVYVPFDGHLVIDVGDVSEEEAMKSGWQAVAAGALDPMLYMEHMGEINGHFGEAFASDEGPFPDFLPADAEPDAKRLERHIRRYGQWPMARPSMSMANSHRGV